MQALFDNLGYEISWHHTWIVGGLILARLIILINLLPFLFGTPVPAMV